jgi:hypothetical protein
VLPETVRRVAVVVASVLVPPTVKNPVKDRLGTESEFTVSAEMVVVAKVEVPVTLNNAPKDVSPDTVSLVAVVVAKVEIPVANKFVKVVVERFVFPLTVRAVDEAPASVVCPNTVNIDTVVVASVEVPNVVNKPVNVLLPLIFKVLALKSVAVVVARVDVPVTARFCIVVVARFASDDVATTPPTVDVSIPVVVAYAREFVIDPVCTCNPLKYRFPAMLYRALVVVEGVVDANVNTSVKFPFVPLSVVTVILVPVALLNVKFPRADRPDTESVVAVVVAKVVVPITPSA